MTRRGQTIPRGAGVAAAILAAVVLHFVSNALLPFVLAGIVAFVTEPVLAWTEARTRAPRWAIASGLYLLLAVGGVGLAVFTGVQAARNVQALASGGPAQLRATLQGVLGQNGIQLFGERVTPEAVAAWLQAEAQRLGHSGLLVKLARPALEGGVGLVLFAVLTFYLMLSGPELAQGALRLAPPAWRGDIRRHLPALATVVRSYFVGVIAVVAFTMVAAWIGYGLVLHVRDALVLSAAVGVLETVPVIGPITAAALVWVSALQLHSLWRALAMVGYALGLRFCIDDVVAPLVLGRSVALHPVVVMLAYAFGAIGFGITGLLLAVPAAACLRIVLKAAYGEQTPEQAHERR